MFCTACGKRVPDGARFCPECGKKIVSESAAEKVSRTAEELEKSVRDLGEKAGSFAEETGSTIKNEVRQYNQDCLIGFILSIIGLFFPLVSIGGLILSCKGLKEIDPAREKGQDLGRVGKILSIIGLVFTVILATAVFGLMGITISALLRAL